MHNLTLFSLFQDSFVHDLISGVLVFGVKVTSFVFAACCPFAWELNALFAPAMTGTETEAGAIGANRGTKTVTGAPNRRVAGALEAPTTAAVALAARAAAEAAAVAVRAIPLP